MTSNSPRIDETRLSVGIRRARPNELPRLQVIDAAACSLFAPIGLHVNLPETHPFVLAECERWAKALAKEQVLIALDSKVEAGEQGELAAFAVVGRQDGQPYLDQLSVHPKYMRRGIGTALLREVIDMSGPAPLWLTTYAHVAWNAPYYAKFGFRVVDDAGCGPDVRLTLRDQRAALPSPEQRIAMVRHHADPGICP
jgi:ribosomal protein S18 acetylase RimI-like enzyme